MTFSLTYLELEENKDQEQHQRQGAVNRLVGVGEFVFQLVYLLPADIISNGAALFPPRFPEAGVTESEGGGKFSELEIPRVNRLPELNHKELTTHNFIAEVVVLPVVRVAGAFLGRPGGVEDQQRS